MILALASWLRLHPRRLGFLLLLAVSAGSCARHLPTAPARSAWHSYPAGSEATASLDSADCEVMLTLAPGVDPVAFGQQYGAQLVESTDWGGASYLPQAGETSDNFAARVRSDPRVVTSERNASIETAEARQKSMAFDDGTGSPQMCSGQPAMTYIALNSALGVSDGSGVRVAILDTGAELTHPALVHHIAGGWDFVAGDSDPTDAPDGLNNLAYGHGTHVAGIVAFTAPRAELLIVRVLNGDGRGDILSVASGIRWAIDHGARVINMSLGMLVPSAAIENLLAEAEQRAIVCVVAAGNWGSDSPIEYPASSVHALAVAATDDSGHAASFTSHGSFVALSAPGVNIRSAYHGGRYALWSGTSMSAPFVSGAAALLLSRHPSWNRQMVLDRLASSSLPLDALNPDIAEELGAGGLTVGPALAPDAPARLGEVQTPDPAPIRRR